MSAQIPWLTLILSLVLTLFSGGKLSEGGTTLNLSSGTLIDSNSGQPVGSPSLSKHGVVFPGAQSLQFKLEHAARIEGIKFLAPPRQRFLFLGSNDGKQFERLWKAPPALDQNGSRQSPKVTAALLTQYLRVEPLGAGPQAQIQSIHLKLVPVMLQQISLQWLLIWLVYGIVLGATFIAPFAGQTLSIWKRADPYLAAGLFTVLWAPLGLVLLFTVVAYAGFKRKF